MSAVAPAASISNSAALSQEPQDKKAQRQRREMFQASGVYEQLKKQGAPPAQIKAALTQYLRIIDRNGVYSMMIARIQSMAAEIQQAGIE